MTSDHQSEAHLTELLEGKNLLPPGINSFFQETSVAKCFKYLLWAFVQVASCL